MNEDTLIHWIKSQTRLNSDVRIGIGDDAAMLKCPDKGKEWLFKTDMLIDQVHFDSKKKKPFNWGYKAMMCNISDIAAMGGLPKAALIAVGMPKRMTMAQAKQIFRGLQSAADKFNVKIIGGDTNQSDRIVICVMLTGWVDRQKVVKRSGARPGDMLFVTGPLGGSFCSGRHERFTARVKESQYLINHYSVNAMMDLSDGLAKDLRRMSAQSNVGFCIFESALPLHADCTDMKQALLDGEDFELLFSLSMRQASKLLQDNRLRRLGITVYPIGRALKKSNDLILIGKDGKKRKLPRAKEHHFN